MFAVRRARSAVPERFLRVRPTDLADTEQSVRIADARRLLVPDTELPATEDEAAAELRRLTVRCMLALRVLLRPAR